MSTCPRFIALEVIQTLMEKKKPLSDLLAKIQHSDKALISELSYGVCRYYFFLQFIAKNLLKKGIKAKDNDIYYGLLIGLYELHFLSTKPHAVVNEIVKLADKRRKPWAKALLNACLRGYLRHKEDFSSEEETVLYSHPAWLIKRLKNAWPRDYQRILQANNQRPPFILRVNLAKISRVDYLAQLNSHGFEAVMIDDCYSAIRLLTPCKVDRLPGFWEGLVSVQDVSAQRAKSLLNLQADLNILDACAAPGGKTCHLLESALHFKQMIALDNDPRRLEKVKANLERLQLKAKVICADACATETWFDGEPFDRILLDAPCSATGVIRRHPDIKLLRTPIEVKEIVLRQKALLNSLWPLLKKGGELLYATCSILPEENDLQIASFVANHEVEVLPIKQSFGIQQKYGIQILPGEGDGFYYARLRKI